MNEYQCGCGKTIVKETIIGMLDALASHIMDCPEGAKEAQPLDTFDRATKKRPYPSRALYRGIKAVRVIGYAGDGYFICLWNGDHTSIHRRHLTFTKS